MAHLYNGLLLGNKKKLAIHPLKDMDESQMNVAKVKDASLKRLYILYNSNHRTVYKRENCNDDKNNLVLPRRNGRFEWVKHRDFFRW